MSQVRGPLPQGWEATLLAGDGSTTDHIASQLGRLPTDATHLVLSVGGNNALTHLGILESPVSSMAKSIEALADMASDFEVRYRVVIAPYVPLLKIMPTRSSHRLADSPMVIPEVPRQCAKLEGDVAERMSLTGGI